jgi:hypothetical protein
MNLFQNQSPTCKTFKISLFYLSITTTQYHFGWSSSNATIKSGIENINNFDEEAHTSQEKTSCFFLATRDAFGNVSDKRIIIINYYIFIIYFLSYLCIFHHFLFIVLYFSLYLIIDLFIYEFIKLNKFLILFRQS